MKYNKEGNYEGERAFWFFSSHSAPLTLFISSPLVHCSYLKWIVHDTKILHLLAFYFILKIWFLNFYDLCPIKFFIIMLLKNILISSRGIIFKMLKINIQKILLQICNIFQQFLIFGFTFHLFFLQGLKFSSSIFLVHKSFLREIVIEFVVKFTATFQPFYV